MLGVHKNSICLPQRRGPKTQRGKARSSQNARKYAFSKVMPLTEIDNAGIEALRQDPWIAGHDHAQGLACNILFALMRKTFRIRDEIENLTRSIVEKAISGDFESFDRDLDTLRKLHVYERKSRSEFASRIMASNKDAESKISSVRRREAQLLAQKS